VGPVAELFGGGTHPLPGLLGDAGVFAQRIRYGGDADAALRGDVLEGDSSAHGVKAWGMGSGGGGEHPWPAPRMASQSAAWRINVTGRVGNLSRRRRAWRRARRRGRPSPPRGFP